MRGSDRPSQRRVRVRFLSDGHSRCLGGHQRIQSDTLRTQHLSFDVSIAVQVVSSLKCLLSRTEDLFASGAHTPCVSMTTHTTARAETASETRLNGAGEELKSTAPRYRGASGGSHRGYGYRTVIELRRVAKAETPLKPGIILLDVEPAFSIYAW